MKSINSELKNKQTELFRELPNMVQEQLSGGQFSSQASSKRDGDDDDDLPDIIIWDIDGGS